jgi:hypothetical protein
MFSLPARLAFSFGSKLLFWRGEGYMLDDKLTTHVGRPGKPLRSWSDMAFDSALHKAMTILKSYMLITHWYYYVFKKSTQH